ncbi:hypothetical protein [Amycolatopsis suaedae]|uniref:Uncharacterized protein n=1 Tax=Amycolatopsis suaedae TaxID=2510978 RepID=A0A4Q7J383_9PSEU|nr:hypothetical protein [Amycolatopsis suaedae]RZQ61072.1 hypothetical protein EWH70_24590 [Amycolatopsis suaedae]
MFSWLRKLMGRPASADAESDVATDPANAGSRVSGGDTGRRGGDAESTTGPGPNDTHVGRVAGQDEGFAGDTGAEARSRDT